MDVSLLLLGRDGNGKSSTGNSIFGKKCFQTSSNHTSVAVGFENFDSKIDNRHVTLMEVSGLECVNSFKPSIVVKTFEEIGDKIKDSQKGFSAMIITLKYGLRFTRQEQEYIEMVKSTFGSNVIRDYGVIVWTYGDMFDLDMEENNQTFENWCETQTGGIHDLFAECDKRFVLFNNRTKDDQTSQHQRDKLFSKIDSIQSKPYMEKNYQEAADNRTKILVTSTLQGLEKKTQDILNDIQKKLTDMTQASDDNCDIKTTLENLQEELQKHQKKLEDEDKNTGILKQLIGKISITQTAITTKLKIVEQYISRDGFLLVEEADCKKPDEDTSHVLQIRDGAQFSDSSAPKLSGFPSNYVENIKDNNANEKLNIEWLLARLQSLLDWCKNFISPSEKVTLHLDLQDLNSQVDKTDQNLESKENSSTDMQNEHGKVQENSRTELHNKHENMYPTLPQGVYDQENNRTDLQNTHGSTDPTAVLADFNKPEMNCSKNVNID